MATELWICDTTTDLVYRIDASDGTVLQQITAPDTFPAGVAVDLDGDLWVLGGADDTIYRLNPSDGTVLQSFAHPSADFPRGLAFDSGGDLWTGDTGAAEELKRVDPADGTVLQTIALAFDIGGVAVDINGDLWVTDTDNNRIKRLDPSDGTVLDNYASPSTSPTGIGVDSDGDLWHCDVASDVVYRIDPSNGSVLAQFAAPNGAPRGMSDAFWIFPEPPHAPTLLDPVDNTVLDVAEDYTFDWDFEDVNEGDSQTAYDLRYREQGTSTWTDLSGNSTDTVRVIAGGTFTAGKTYEWQVRTTDTDGLTGPYSSSEFFDAAAQPDPPTIDAPTLDEVIGSASYTVEWTTATQNAYRVRVVADDGAGSPDESTVVEDTGIRESASTRSRSMPFETDGVTQHVQVQTRYDGLWSDWATVRVDVDYTAPATPTVTLQEGLPESAITVDADHPAPSGTEPTVTSMDVQRSPSGESDWTTIAAGLDPDDTYADYAVASDTLYDYRVVAYASSNGTSSTSDAETGRVSFCGTWLLDPADPDGSVWHFEANRAGGTDSTAVEVVRNRFAGRARPVAEFGEHIDDSVDVELYLRDDDETDALRDLIDLRTVLLYRDGTRRKVFGIVAQVWIATRVRGALARFAFAAVDHDEAV